MANPLQGGIAKQIYKAMKAAKLTLPATLIKVTPGTRTPGSLTGGTNPSTTSYAASGFVADYSDDDIDGTLVIRGDRKISLFGSSFPAGVVPEPEDKITITDPSGVSRTYRIVPKGVTTDPAGAVYTCQGRA